MNKKYIMVHHSLTADGPLVSWGAIERYHVETMGWDDVGYHYGVEQLGDRFYALVGRPEYKNAAACYQDGMNRKAIHVCCVGNYDLSPPSRWMLETAVRRVVVPLVVKYQIPVENIIGHRDRAGYKTCPGSQFDLNDFRSRVLKELGL